MWKKRESWIRKGVPLDWCIHDTWMREEGLAQRTWDWQRSYKKILAWPTAKFRAKTMWRSPQWAEMARPTSPALLGYWLAAYKKHYLCSNAMTDPEDEMNWRLWRNSTHCGKFVFKGRSEQDALRLLCVLKGDQGRETYLLYEKIHSCFNYGSVCWYSDKQNKM